MFTISYTIIDRNARERMDNMAQEKRKEWGHLLIKNAISFVFNLVFVFIGSALFGNQNILTIVALSVGFTMLPKCDLGIRPGSMFVIILFLFPLSGIIAQFALLSPMIAFPVFFTFMLVLILCTNEPMQLKPSMPFLLSFIFSEATAVPWEQFASRLLCLLVLGFLVALTTFISWKQKGYGKEGRCIREQMHLCHHNRSYMFRMAFGVSLAMTMGMIFHLIKPLWVSIVVMSLTQLEFQETVSRMKDRFIGTLLGTVIFFLFLQVLIPSKYAMVFILFLGYISFFFSEYKHKQVINAVSALNASLVLLDTKTAIMDRILYLLWGIALVLIIYGMAQFLKYLKNKWEERDSYQRQKTAYS